MKVLRKIFAITTIIIFLIPTFVPPVHAKTVADLKNELQQKQNELQQNKNKQNLTEQQINNANAEIETVKASINQTYVDIAALDKEIELLNEDIKKKDQQIKEIVNFMQVSNGESAYLEYAFGAKDFTDFIYRVAVAEQLAEYNNNLIDECNKKIESSKQKQKEIENKRNELSSKQEQLQKKVKELGKELETLSDTSIDIEDEIEYQKEIIKLYENKGCKDNEDISTCGRKTLPVGTAFYRPIVAGRVTSEWGYRNLGSGWHEGIDFGIAQGTTVYAIANGMVAKTLYRNSCGGNMVIIHHNINGKTYTSVYAHLNSINVSEGTTVTRNTIIGYSGGGRNTMSPSNVCGLSGGTGWDRCSCGEHLHLTIATGLYGVDYNFTQMNYKYSINPRLVINLPSGSGRFENRIEEY